MTKSRNVPRPVIATKVNPGKPVLRETIVAPRLRPARIRNTGCEGGNPHEIFGAGWSEESKVLALQDWPYNHYYPTPIPFPSAVSLPFTIVLESL